MKAIMPFIPHISCECLSKLEGKDFYSKIEWPRIEKSLLKDENVVIVVQVNGKLKDRIEAASDLSENDIQELALGSERIKEVLTEFVKVQKSVRN
mgnify:CR=1 FL=1